MARKAASLELAVLGLLHESPLHGYELRKRLNLLLGWGRLLSYGSLYPALKRMLRAGWITEVTAATPGVSRRQRIVYQITAGRPAVLRRADHRQRPVRVGGRQLQHAVRVLLPHRRRGPAAHPRGSPHPAPGAARPRPRTPRPAATTATSASCGATPSSPSSVRSRWLTDLINAERRPTDPGASPTRPPRPATPAPEAPPRRAQPVRRP